MFAALCYDYFMRNILLSLLALLLAAAARPALLYGDKPDDVATPPAAADKVAAQREKLKQEILNGPCAEPAVDPVLVTRLPEWIAALDAPDSAARDTALENIFACGEAAMPVLENSLRTAVLSPEMRWRLDTVHFRIHWRLTQPLLNVIGDLFETFAQADVPGRRVIIFHLCELGGPAAIPTLRAIVRLDPDEWVRQTATDAITRLVIEPNAAKLRKLMTTAIADLEAKRFEPAVDGFLAVLALDPGNSAAAYNIACAYALQQNFTEAMPWLNKSMELGFRDLRHIMEDPDLEALRGRAEFDTLMKEVFGATYRARYEETRQPASTGADTGKEK